MKRKTRNYGNDSISALKGADRVRLRPGVIFGSDGLEGCQQSFLKFYQIQLMKPGKASEKKSESYDTVIFQ